MLYIWCINNYGNIEARNSYNIYSLQDGDRFWRMPECYIRGSTIKYLRIPDEVIDMVKEDAQAKSRNRTEMNKNRGGNASQNQRGGRPGGNRNNVGNRPGQGYGGPGNNAMRLGGAAGQGNRLPHAAKNRK